MKELRLMEKKSVQCIFSLVQVYSLAMVLWLFAFTIHLLIVTSLFTESIVQEKNKLAFLSMLVITYGIYYYTKQIISSSRD